ncbi:RDD family protein [Neobacillus vireti]|uniref:RDD family protein n=1 Tax=Neobacillus vireti TaxID=220686 RepID=UPI003000AA41
MELPKENAWFYIRDHQQQGPVGFFELRKLFEQGILPAETYIWNKDLDDWQMANRLYLLPESSFKYKLADSTVNLTGTWRELHKDTYPTGRPFVRYLARFFDLSLFSFFLITFVSIFSPSFLFESSGLFIFILNLILYISVEAVILSIFGNTIGKAILNLRLYKINGDRLDFLTAIKRSIYVTGAGMGFGVPIINLVCFYFSYLDLKKNGKSTWDREIETIVLYGQVSTARILFACFLPMALFIAGFVV